MVGDRALVTGGCGFIGSHLVERLLATGIGVTILDDMSNPFPGTPELINRPGVRLVAGSVLDATAAGEAVADANMVWHLAANSKIERGQEDPALDLRTSVMGTQTMLESMRQHNVSHMVFASSGAVYGDLGSGLCNEKAGPLLPVSLYGAGKLGAEAAIAAYASTFGIRAHIFRFGNVLGTRMSRGAIHDFIERLLANPDYLKVWGDGRQTKSYFLVEDCLDGMAWACQHVRLTEEEPVQVLNLGSSGGTSVAQIAQEVLAAVGRPDLPVRYTGGARAFAGDQPVVHLDVSRMDELGWRARMSSDNAVRTAVARIVESRGAHR